MHYKKDRKWSLPKPWPSSRISDTTSARVSVQVGLRDAACSTVHIQVFESSICIVEEQFDMLLDCRMWLVSDSWIRIKSCVAWIWLSWIALYRIELTWIDFNCSWIASTWICVVGKQFETVLDYRMRLASDNCLRIKSCVVWIGVSWIALHWIESIWIDSNCNLIELNWIWLRWSSFEAFRHPTGLYGLELHRTDRNWIELSWIQARPSQGKPSQVKPSQAKSSHAKSNWVRLWQDKAREVKPSQAKSSQAKLLSSAL